MFCAVDVVDAKHRDKLLTDLKNSGRSSLTLFDLLEMRNTFKMAKNQNNKFPLSDPGVKVRYFVLSSFDSK